MTTVDASCRARGDGSGRREGGSSASTAATTRTANSSTSTTTTPRGVSSLAGPPARRPRPWTTCATRSPARPTRSRRVSRSLEKFREVWFARGATAISRPSPRRCSGTVTGTRGPARWRPSRRTSRRRRSGRIPRLAGSVVEAATEETEEEEEEEEEEGGRVGLVASGTTLAGGRRATTARTSRRPGSRWTPTRRRPRSRVVRRCNPRAPSRRPKKENATITTILTTTRRTGTGRCGVSTPTFGETREWEWEEIPAGRRTRSCRIPPSCTPTTTRPRATGTRPGEDTRLGGDTLPGEEGCREGRGRRGRAGYTITASGRGARGRWGDTTRVGTTRSERDFGGVFSFSTRISFLVDWLVVSS